MCPKLCGIQNSLGSKIFGGKKALEAKFFGGGEWLKSYLEVSVARQPVIEESRPSARKSCIRRFEVSG